MPNDTLTKDDPNATGAIKKYFNEMHQAIQDAYPTMDMFKLLVGTRMRDIYDFSEISGEASTTTVKRVLDDFIALRYLNQLLERACDGKMNPQLGSVTDKLMPYLRPDCFKTYFIYDQIFLSRKKLRQELRELHEGEARVLVINAPDPDQNKRCGKSHSSELVKYVGTVRKKFQAISVDAKKGATALLDAEKLTSLLMARMGVGAPPFEALRDPADPPAIYIQKLCKHIHNVAKDKAQKSGLSWCFVLDNFNHSLLPDSTNNLIKGLVNLIDVPLLGVDVTTDDSALVPYRLVLINYTQPLLMRNPERLHTEAIETFQRQDIREAVAWACKRRTGDEIEVVIESVTNEIIRKIPGQDLSDVETTAITAQADIENLLYASGQ